MSNRRVTVTIAPPAPMLYKEAPAPSRSFTRQERIDTTCAVLLAALLIFLLGAFIPRAEAAPATLQPCATEDYSGPDACYWDATQRGNHAGRSFTWTGSSVVYATK